MAVIGGVLVIGTAPTQGYHAATKGYVDSLDATRAPSTAVTSGEEVIPRDVVGAANVAMTSGTLRLTYFTARVTESITQVRAYSGTANAAGTITLIRFGIYTIDGSGNGTLTASTVSDTALFAATGTGYTKSLSSTWSKVAGTRYAVGILAVATTPPNLTGQSISSNINDAIALDPRLTGNIASQSDLPSTFTAASVSVAASRPYILLLP